MGYNRLLQDAISYSTVMRDRWLHHVVFLAPAVPLVKLSSRSKQP
jgi:hypothetical protein